MLETSLLFSFLPPVQKAAEGTVISFSYVLGAVFKVDIGVQVKRRIANSAFIYSSI